LDNSRLLSVCTISRQEFQTISTRKNPPSDEFELSRQTILAFGNHFGGCRREGCLELVVLGGGSVWREWKKSLAGCEKAREWRVVS
jgi:uridylate kinase